MTIESIKTAEDYQKALDRLEIIFDGKKNSPEGEELEVLSILIEKYEDENFPVELSD